jgi:phosphatidylglycerophosphatase A
LSQDISPFKGPIERIPRPRYRFIIKIWEGTMKKTFEWPIVHWRILIVITAWAAIIVLVFFIFLFEELRIKRIIECRA